MQIRSKYRIADSKQRTPRTVNRVRLGMGDLRKSAETDSGGVRGGV
jgi:hypothetical protein